MNIEIYSRENDNFLQIESIKYFADNELTGDDRKVITDSIDAEPGLADGQIIQRIETWIIQEGLFDKLSNKLKIYQAWKFMESIKGKLWSECTESEKNNFIKIINKLAWREFRQLDLD